MSGITAPLTGPGPEQSIDAWFEEIARRLLWGACLDTPAERFFIREVEFYLHGPGHEDPFAHQHPKQLEVGTWYFHRAGQSHGSYRGGSFKGLDITFGEGAFGGILIRTLDTPGGVINGSSLCVDALLEACACRTVAELDAAVAGREIDDRESPLRVWFCAPNDFTLYRSARVGLTLKRAAEHPTMPDFIERPYRFMVAPWEIKKGRDLLARSLFREGHGVEEIAALLGSGEAAVRRWVGAAPSPA